jgi:hypothetical protein
LEVRKAILLCLVLWLPVAYGRAQNPLIMDQFTADPSARVIGDSLYVYPSHDIHWGPGKGRANWFCMEDYHVFSSADLTHWRDHGVIVSQAKVAWVDSTAYSMWAPDCIERDGRYYFYFPSRVADTANGRGFAIGVAVAEHPWGPFVAVSAPIPGVRGIDPNVFIDKDGQAYLYWAEGKLYGAKLAADMLHLASAPVVLGDLPEKGLKEGPFLFERDGKYYLTYPHVDSRIERLEYAMGNAALGPFTVMGVLMDESSSGCWTNHQSVVRFRGQWFLFYHNDDLSPDFDKNRAIRADSLTFNGDGTIRKVIPTLRGAGVSNAWEPIQLDRYSRLSAEDVSVAFLDTADRFKGWKLVYGQPGTWVQYNSVNFGRRPLERLRFRAVSAKGAILEARLDSANGPLLGRVTVPAGAGWGLVDGALTGFRPGVHHLFVFASGAAEVDWMECMP